MSSNERFLQYYLDLNLRKLCVSATIVDEERLNMVYVLRGQESKLIKMV
jgi:hypothetical protein